MHCPGCGQQQVSIDIKFCSRCGFPMGLVSEILAHGGFLPQLADLHKKKSFWTKKNGVILSLFWFLFFLFIMAPFWAIVDVEELAAISAVVGIFGGLMLMVASLVFLKSSKEPLLFHQPQNPMQMNYNTNQNLYGAGQQHALPPQQSIPASSYVPPIPGSWRETNDLVQPGSVTDETTRILQNKETR